MCYIQNLINKNHVRYQKLSIHWKPSDVDFNGFIDDLLFITAGSIFRLRSLDMSNSDRDASTYASITDSAYTLR